MCTLQEGEEGKGDVATGLPIDPLIRAKETEAVVRQPGSEPEDG